MSEQFEMIAKTFQGLEEILAEELTALGANDIQIGRRMVSFTGDKRMMYKANFCLRTAIRILKPIKNFTAKDADEVYNQIQAIPWEEYLDVNKTFAIDAVVFSEEFRHSKFVSYKVKDAIVDYFRDKTGKRPSVRINNPDVLLNIHIAQTTCTLSLDSSGESLHRRGYRQEAVEAPLNEVLAAGMILMTGWRGECDLIDPMCGSGTIPVEAALIAKNIAPGVFRKGFAFEKWVDFDADMFDEIYNDDSQEREFAHKIYGYDNNPKANEIATHNIKAAGVSKDIVLKLQPFQQFEQPKEKAISPKKKDIKEEPKKKDEEKPKPQAKPQEQKQDQKQKTSGKDTKDSENKGAEDKDAIASALNQARRKATSRTGSDSGGGSSVEQALAQARKNAGGNRGGGGGEGSGPGGGGLHSVYLGQVMLAVRPNWGYASGSRANLQCTVHITVTAAGQVQTAQIVASSGNAQYDASCVNAIWRTSKAGDFPPPPTPMYHELDIVFTLNEMRGR